MAGGYIFVNQSEVQMINYDIENKWIIIQQNKDFRHSKKDVSQKNTLFIWTRIVDLLK